MTASPAATPRSRRAVLAGAVGGAVASFLAAVGRPASVRAGSDGDVVLGALNVADGQTTVSTSVGVGLHGQSSDATGSGVMGYATSGLGATYGVFGWSTSTEGRGVYGMATAGSGTTYGVSGLAASTDGRGVLGNATATSGFTTGVLGQVASPTGRAVYGLSVATSGVSFGVFGATISTSGRGVFGNAAATSGTNFGVFGTSASTSGRGAHGRATASTGATYGVYGRVDSPEGTGVVGYSGTDADPAPVPRTGVYGYGARDGIARGVWGRSNGGDGVFGQATSGHGVRGTSTSGAAGYFTTTYAKQGVSLRATGRVRFDRSAGVAMIEAGADRVTVTPGTDLVSTSAVVATLQGGAGGAVVERVEVDAAQDRFTIILTAAAPDGVRVAWHVFG